MISNLCSHLCCLGLNEKETVSDENEKIVGVCLIEQLPIEMYATIAQYLAVSDFSKLSRTCYTLKQRRIALYKSDGELLSKMLSWIASQREKPEKGHITNLLKNFLRSLANSLGNPLGNPNSLSTAYSITLTIPFTKTFATSYSIQESESKNEIELFLRRVQTTLPNLTKIHFKRLNFFGGFEMAEINFLLSLCPRLIRIAMPNNENKTVLEFKKIIRDLPTKLERSKNLTIDDCELTLIRELKADELRFKLSLYDYFVLSTTM